MIPPAPTGANERAPRATDARWFRPALAVVVGAALALRVVYVFAYRRDFVPGGDAFFYHSGANLLAAGKGFIEPFYEVNGIHLHRAVVASEYNGV